MENHINVYVRVKPSPNPSSPCTNTQVFIGNEAYTFDSVWDSTTSNIDIFSIYIVPLLENFIESKNVTILVYGQSGTGKSYTMGLGTGEGGIIQYALQWLFEKYTLVLKSQFIEICNEQVMDLFSLKKLAVRDTGLGKINAVGLTSIEISSYGNAIETINSGIINRTTRCTSMNAASSRSHAILTLQRGSTCLTFVDLAGSERVKRSHVTGMAFQESVSINSGLLALANCINSLVQGKKHVPYRESKITRLLQDSLQGNQLLAMICCVSMESMDMSETLNTLKYGSRAKGIRVQKLAQPSQLSEYEILAKENKELKMRILELEREIERMSSASKPMVATKKVTFNLSSNQEHSISLKESFSSERSISIEGDSFINKKQLHIGTHWGKENRTRLSERLCADFDVLRKSAKVDIPILTVTDVFGESNVSYSCLRYHNSTLYYALSNYKVGMYDLIKFRRTDIVIESNRITKMDIYDSKVIYFVRNQIKTIDGEVISCRSNITDLAVCTNIFCGFEDGSLGVFNNEFTYFDLHRGPITSICCIRNNGLCVYSSGRDQRLVCSSFSEELELISSITVFNSKRLVSLVELSGFVHAVTWDRKMICISTSKEIIAHSAQIRLFSSDKESHILSACKDGILKMWNGSYTLLNSRKLDTGVITGTVGEGTLFIAGINNRIYSIRIQC